MILCWLSRSCVFVWEATGLLTVLTLMDCLRLLKRQYKEEGGRDTKHTYTHKGINFNLNLRHQHHLRPPALQLHHPLAPRCGQRAAPHVQQRGSWRGSRISPPPRPASTFSSARPTPWPRLWKNHDPVGSYTIIAVLPIGEASQTWTEEYPVSQRAQARSTAMYSREGPSVITISYVSKSADGPRQAGAAGAAGPVAVSSVRIRANPQWSWATPGSNFWNVIVIL